MHVRLLLLLAFLALALACGDSPSRAAPSADMAAPPPPASASAPLRPTATDAGIAMHNLSAQIEDARRTLEKRPSDLAVRLALFDLLRQRASVLDAPDDLLDAAQLASQAPLDFPQTLDAHLLAVRGHSALHRFRAARAYLESNVLCTAAKGGDAAKPPSKSLATASPSRSCPVWKGALDPDQRDRLVAGLDLATGRYDAAEPVFRRLADANKSWEIFHLHALALGAMGRVDEADRRFDDALASYRNVSPFPLTEIHADRAAMWQRSGQMDRATRDLEVANLLLPGHVHVATHLAALRAPRAAVALLTPLASDTRSADLLSTLGTFEDMSKSGAGDLHLTEARRRFEELERLAPEAWADHAAWFWVGPGRDPGRALRLAEINLAERQTSEAFELAIRAATDAGDRSKACELGGRAAHFAYPSDLLVLYLRQLGDCPPGSARPTPAPSPSP